MPPVPIQDLLEIQARIAPDVALLTDAHVLIAGGGGFIGTWMVASLLHATDAAGIPCRVTVLERPAAQYAATHPGLIAHPRLRLVEGDLTDPGALTGVHDVTHVIHAASGVNGRFTPAQAIAAVDTIAGGTRTLLAWARTNPLRRMLYVSSGAVYGKAPVPAADEMTATMPAALGPESAYGLAKRAGELQTCLHALDGGYDAVIARLWAFVGPGLPLHGPFAVGNFVRDALAGRPIVVLGDGTPVRTYQYAGDMAVWMWALLVRGAANQAYNVGSDAEVTIAELARVVDAELGGQGVEIRGRPVPGAAPDRYVPAIAKAKALGLDNRIDLREGIRRMARSQR